MNWKVNHFNPKNQAGMAEYRITDNGKAYIVPEKPGEVGLSEEGMYEFVKDWIAESSIHAISDEQKKELIRLLSE